jgi:diguanylate cyclase
MEHWEPHPPPEAMYRWLVETSADLLQVTDQYGRISYASPSSPSLLRRTDEDGLGTLWIDWIHEQDKPRMEQALHQLLQIGKPFTQEFRIPLPDGTSQWLEGKGSLLPSNDPTYYAAFYSRDITQWKHQEEQLTKLAYYDALTGLPNRRLFQDRYSQLMLSAKRYGHRLGVLYLDLDDFKQINDTYGHAFGDEFLKVVASRLNHSIRDPDTVCRVGGDEFVILLQRFDSKVDLGRIAARLLDALSQPFELQSRKVQMTCSIGGACYPEDASEGDVLLRQADTAMYAAKKYGKNNYTIHLG